MIVSICSCVHINITFLSVSAQEEERGGGRLVKCHKCDDGGVGERGLTPSEVEM